MSDEIERCILVKNEVFVYKIPPRASARGYRAADWNLSAPDWTGRLRVVTGGKVNFIILLSSGCSAVEGGSFQNHFRVIYEIVL